MSVDFTPLAVLLFAIIAQAVFAAGLLWAAPVNRLPNRFLALLMLAIALWLLDAFFRVSGIYGRNAEWYFAPIYYSLAFGPLLYFYVQSLVNHDFRWRGRYWWHFGPVLVQAGLYWWLRFEPYAVRSWFWLHVHRPVTYRLEFLGTWVSMMVYLLLSLRLLRRYGRYLNDNFSETSRLRLRWLRVLLLALAVVSAQWLLELVLREFFDLYYRYDYSSELLGGVVFVIGIVGLRQADMQAVRFVPEAGPETADEENIAPSLAPTNATTETERVITEPTSGGPERAPAPEVDAAVLERLRHAFEVERLYLNPTLTLAEVSAHTGLAPRLISFAVNQGFGKSFNDLVNGYRVAEVKRRLASPADVARLTLLGIAFESGFNSKTTFNRIFKQFTGQSPSEYRVGE
ncbi:helix-turn-helix transcriptional regulator [Hymenobacter busanensis]|uniref:Helix-turn-helix transcriptional regulator n=1 Tax=Hymenobacter busanensis TaxID=2607656 RepID=A0A7L5A255_9BACT|nr:AraC family transcriptional regulator [Hymenobacter busanensis]KAA9338198.1 helix-turn-helix transcriptional regulator [Hymenobacter busanensis]QHJ09377.1 helix-turn-helix domain-containing protein [Hymenobacter busanensis]